MKKPTQWGIMGCGSIANLFARSLSVLPEGELLAGASRTPGRAKEFAKTHGLQRSYTEYDSFLADPEVEAVYVATTHNFHYENVKACLKAGKHVLCEKPFTVNVVQAEELIGLAREKECFLMEAMWTRFLPAIIRLQALLAEGVIGDVRAVSCDFCVDGSGFEPEHRMRNKALAGGAVLDLGIYPITFADIVFDAVPERIQSSAMIGDTGVDERSFYLLDYPGGRYAQLSASFSHAAPIEGMVHGTEGYIRVPHFLGAEGFEVHRNKEEPTIHTYAFGDGESFKFEIAHAMECITAGRLESDVHPLSKTVSILQIMDDLRRQWDLKYPEEE